MTIPQQETSHRAPPDSYEPSTPPAMNPPSRSPPSLPPHEAFKNTQLPAPHQYGVAPASGHIGWTAQPFPAMDAQVVPARSMKGPTLPYQEKSSQTWRQEQYQPVQQAPYNGPWLPRLPIHREQTRSVVEPVTQQGQPRRLPEYTETGPQRNYDSRLTSSHGDHQRQVSRSIGPEQVRNHGQRLASYQGGQPFQSARPVEPQRLSSQEPRLPTIHKHGVSADRVLGRPDNYDPRVGSYQEDRRRRVSESTEPIWHPNYGSREQPYREKPQYRVAEEARTGRPTYRNISAPFPPQTASQGSSDHLAPSTRPITDRPTRPGLSPPLPGTRQDSHVSQEINRPPIPLAPRSKSQPPEPRNARQPSPQSNKLRKPEYTEIRAPKLPYSPDVSPRVSPQASPRISPGGSPQASPRISPQLQPRSQSESLLAPSALSDVSILYDNSSRPDSYHSDAGSSDGKVSKRRSWMPGKSRQSSQDMTALVNGLDAWVIGGQTRIPYNIEPLLAARKVTELWDDYGDTFVYLFPEESRRGSSFRIPSAIISSSTRLRLLTFGHSQGSLRRRARSFDGRSTLSAIDATRFINGRKPATPPTTPHDSQTSSDGSAESVSSLGETTRKESHLYFPTALKNTSRSPQQSSQAEQDHLLSVRNLFAFLMGRPLVATRNMPTIFSVLRVIANQLKELGFSNADGSTYGEAATTSLRYYIESLSLKAVASSREKTLEGIVLGESLRYMDLYNEAFTHAVGKYEAVHDIKSPLWDLITSDTRNRLERAFMDLRQRQQSVQLRLSDFEFPSLFAGFAASTSSAASKVVRFKGWKTSFLALRRHVLSYYKNQYGDWPPRAKSKKNNFSVSGLNRLVLKTLFKDFCTVYDLLVDRESLTNRSMDIHQALPEGETESELTASALRKVESEYDHSSPPVQPPIPFDVPKMPTIRTIDSRINESNPKVRQQAEMRKLQSHETVLMLTKSHNLASHNLDSNTHTSFLKAFRTFEEKEAKNKNAQDLLDQRCGYWLFIYVVLQALPMIVVDAPGLQNTEGVEYFLCQPPIGGAPWMEDANVLRRAWYGVAGSSGVVALPSDVVDHGVEAIYRRSHCWIVADKWLEAGHCPPLNDEEHQDLDESFERREAHENKSGRYHEGLRDGQSRPLSMVAESMVASPINNRESLSPPIQYSSTRPRARSASNHRRSIAFGLEQLPVPPGFNMSPHTSPQLSSPMGSQTLPSNNDTAHEAYNSGLGIVSSYDRPSYQTAGASVTENGAQVKSLEQILSSLEQDRGKKEKTRRKSFINLLDL